MRPTSIASAATEISSDQQRSRLARQPHSSTIVNEEEGYAIAGRGHTRQEESPGSKEQDGR